jgi:hypothetical protein
MLSRAKGAEGQGSIPWGLKTVFLEHFIGVFVAGQ